MVSIEQVLRDRDDLIDLVIYFKRYNAHEKISLYIYIYINSLKIFN